MASNTMTTMAWDHEVQAFAEAHGLVELLPKLVDAARRIFPDNEGVSVYAEDDPEIANERSIMIDVVDPYSSVEEYMRRKKLWHQTLFTLEGTPHRCLVVLRVRSQA